MPVNGATSATVRVAPEDALLALPPPPPPPPVPPGLALLPQAARIATAASAAATGMTARSIWLDLVFKLFVAIFLSSLAGGAR